MKLAIKAEEASMWRKLEKLSSASPFPLQHEFKTLKTNPFQLYFFPHNNMDSSNFSLAEKNKRFQFCYELREKCATFWNGAFFCDELIFK